MFLPVFVKDHPVYVSDRFLELDSAPNRHYPFSPTYVVVRRKKERLLEHLSRRLGLVRAGLDAGIRLDINDLVIFLEEKIGYINHSKEEQRLEKSNMGVLFIIS